MGKTHVEERHTEARSAEVVFPSIIYYSSWRTFHEVVVSTYRVYTWKTCILCLDDVFIFSKDMETHLKDMDEILTIMEAAGLTINIAKCRFFTKGLMYLGHKIKSGTFTVDPSRTKALRELQKPTTKSELRSFLGFINNVYRIFIPVFAGTVTQLYQLPRKTKHLKLAEFGEAEKESFFKLRRSLTSSPILVQPNLASPIFWKPTHVISEYAALYSNQLGTGPGS